MNKPELTHFPQPIDKRAVCAFCLKAALIETWGEKEASINIDTMWLLTSNYRQSLTSVFGGLKIAYPPEIAWNLLLRFFNAVENQRN